MSVTQLYTGGIVTREQKEALEAMDFQIVQAINNAKIAQVPQGLIVAVLHGHDFKETKIMLEMCE